MPRLGQEGEVETPKKKSIVIAGVKVLPYTGTKDLPKAEVKEKEKKTETGSTIITRTIKAGEPRFFLRPTHFGTHKLIAIRDLGHCVRKKGVKMLKKGKKDKALLAQLLKAGIPVN